MAKARKTLVIAAAAVLLPTVLLLPTADRYARATGVLTRLTSGEQASGLAAYRHHVVDMYADMTIPPPGDDSLGVPAKRYVPRGVTKPPVVILLHGVQFLGIEEPRMIAFAKAIAASGVEVVTPLLPRIARFQVSALEVELIGSTARLLHQQRGKPAGVVGMSFSGGLALVAATDPRYAKHISFVAAVGAHHDMERTARFFATGEAPRPDGSTLRRTPHEYGALVLIASAPADFFPAQDVPAAARVLNTLLQTESIDAARPESKALSPAALVIMNRIFVRDRKYFRDALLASIARRQPEMQAVSPRGKLHLIRVPVVLIHGTGDDIIPPSETEWLAREVPPQYLEESLITPLLSHVDVNSRVTAADRAKVVHAMAEILQEAER
jgi:pimeloyl-ACP methyl ester carboxylesterase